MAKQTVVQIYHGILLNNKKERTVDTYNLNGSQENYVEWGKQQSHIVIYCLILSI